MFRTKRINPKLVDPAKGMCGHTQCDGLAAFCDECFLLDVWAQTDFGSVFSVRDAVSNKAFFS